METTPAKLCAESEESMKVLLDAGDGDLLNDAVTSNDSQPLANGIENSWEHRLGTIRQRIEELQDHYDESYLEIGRLLVQARDTYKGHGDWIKWLKGNVPFSVRHAQRLIRIAEMFDDEALVSQLGLTASKAYILTRVGKNDIDHFLHTFFPVGDRPKMVRNMTKRELEVVVMRFLKSKLVSANHEEVTLSNQVGETPRDSVESNLEELKKILSKTILSIRDSDADTRDSWISELEDLYRTGLDQLTPASE